eukprot:scaffold4376_cov77-Cylindrotheca_fusiformis.AAC.2
MLLGEWAPVSYHNASLQIQHSFGALELGTNLLPPALPAFYLKQIVYSRFQTPRQDFHLGCH